MNRICIIEDTPKVAQGIRNALKQDKYEADIFLDASSGRRALKREAYDLLILDIGLPDVSGFEVLATLREVGNALPVLILTARDAVEDRVKGLDLGANDYLVKPFAVPELLARTRRILRDSRPRGEAVSCGDLLLDPLQQKVNRAGEAIELSPLELKLLHYLMINKNQIVSRSMLAADVWETPSRFTPLDNVIEVAVSRLREKIDKPFSSRLLHTVRSVGYLLKEPNEIG